MNRKLAVPLATEDGYAEPINRATKLRTLREDYEDPEDALMLRKLAENRIRILKLDEEITDEFEFEEYGDIAMELDYLKASIQLGLLEVTGELEDIPTSEEIFGEAIA